jgi:hypothetical protein
MAATNIRTSTAKRRKTVPAHINVGRANGNTRAKKIDIGVEKPLGLGIAVPRTKLLASNNVAR